MCTAVEYPGIPLSGIFSLYVVLFLSSKFFWDLVKKMVGFKFRDILLRSIFPGFSTPAHFVCSTFSKFENFLELSQKNGWS